MATGIEPDVVDEPAARPRRRPSPKLVAGLGAVLAVVVAVAGWSLWSGVSASRVHTSWTPACTGTEVSRYNDSSPLGDDELQGEFVIDARPGFACILSVTVRNNSRHDARITSIEGSFLGPKGGAEVMGSTTPQTPALEPADPGGIDASYPLDRALSAGDSMTIDMAVTWREAGCNSGGYLFFGDWPVVRFELLGRAHEAAAEQSFVLRTHDADHRTRDKKNC